MDPFVQLDSMLPDPMQQPFTEKEIILVPGMGNEPVQQLRNPLFGPPEFAMIDKYESDPFYNYFGIVIGYSP